MRRGILIIAAGLVLGTAGWSVAAVNCKQVNNYLSTGRSVQDIAETMVIGEDEVKKCQEEAGSQAAGDAAKAGAKAVPGMDQK